MGTSYLTLRILTRFPNLRSDLESPKTLEKSPKIAYHPLLDLLVLKNVFDYTSTKDLLKVRLVCKTWDFESCSHLRRRLINLKIRDDSEASKFLKTAKTSAGFPAENLFLRISKMNKIHVELFNSLLPQLQIAILKISVTSNDFAALLTNLMDLKSLKTLTVLRHPEDSIESVFVTRDSPIPSRSTSIRHTSQLTNLQSACFKNANPKKRFLCNYTTFIASFLKAADNIKHLEFYYWSTTLTKIFRVVQLHSLEELVVEGRTLGHVDINLLAVKKLKLKRLEICIDKSVSKDSVKELMDAVADTLQQHKIT